MRIILIIAAVFGLLTGSVQARELVVGFVDIPQLIDKSPQALEAARRLEDEFAPRQQKLQKDGQKLDELKAKLKKDSLVMSEAQRSELELEIRRLERDLKREEQDFREELNIKKNNEFKKVRKLVFDAILKFANSGEYDLILSEGVVFAHDRINITQKIIDIMATIGDEKAATE